MTTVTHSVILTKYFGPEHPNKILNYSKKGVVPATFYHECSTSKLQETATEALGLGSCNNNY